MKSSTRHRNRPILPLAAALAAAPLIVLPHPAHAWTSNGVAVSSGTGATQVRDVRTVADGAGGTYVVWADNRTGNLDVYALRLTSQGGVAANWPSNGRAVTNLGGDQLNVQAVTDGAGGLLMCWEDYRHGTTNADIYAQRLTADGNRAPGWIADGLPVCTADNDQLLPSLISDNAGGAIVVWYDFRPPHFNGGTPVAYAQRVTSTCNTSWTTDGITIAPAGSFSFTNPDLGVVSDGAGGGIVTWSYGRLYGQHFGPTSGLLWGSGGIQLSSISSGSATSAPDGRGGAYTAYVTSNSSTGYDIQVQHVDSAGNTASSDGFALSTANGDQIQPSIAFDGSSGAVVAWLDDQVGGGIYAGKVMASGVASCFALNGTKVSSSVGNVTGMQVQADSQGGVLLTWCESNERIMAQRVLASGVVDPSLPAGMVDNGASAANSPSLAWTASGQAVDAWSDSRSGAAVFASQFTFGAATPASISLTVGGTGRHSALLDWTVPAADPIYGAPTAFEIRYSNSPIPSASWTTATYSELVLALSPGSNQCAEVDGLTPCHTYYLGARAIYCGAYSSPSNSPSGVTACSGNTEVTCGDGLRSEPGTDGATIGDRLDLRVPAPNPASGSCSFGITVPGRSTTKARLEVLDVAGRVVRSFPDLAVGSHDLKWDLRGDDGRRVSSGVYWVRIQLAGEARSRMLLVRE